MPSLHFVAKNGEPTTLTVTDVHHVGTTRSNSPLSLTFAGISYRATTQMGVLFQKDTDETEVVVRMNPEDAATVEENKSASFELR